MSTGAAAFGVGGGGGGPPPRPCACAEGTSEAAPKTTKQSAQRATFDLEFAGREPAQPPRRNCTYLSKIISTNLLWKLNANVLAYLQNAFASRAGTHGGTVRGKCIGMIHDTQQDPVAWRTSRRIPFAARPSAVYFASEHVGPIHLDVPEMFTFMFMPLLPSAAAPTTVNLTDSGLRASTVIVPVCLAPFRSQSI